MSDRATPSAPTVYTVSAAAWDAPPPTYDSIFPSEKGSQTNTPNQNGRIELTPVARSEPDSSTSTQQPSTSSNQNSGNVESGRQDGTFADAKCEPRCAITLGKLDSFSTDPTEDNYCHPTLFYYTVRPVLLRSRSKKKGGDLQQDPVAASTVKHQNTRCKNTKDEYSTRRKRDTRHVNIKHKRLHINLRDQWVTGADFGRPSVTQVANGVVILDYVRTTLSLLQLPRGLEERTVVV
ncbi:hypothetical protein FSP39_012457 [Pinctada imbricata]|uniref:Uncharacterized protein n=1 Tax=Pinctada imbricata TaxID=66713 RepID=A0AA88YID0_PINIB|nr:hypothetical protein FSP39_012457 [Pinctada imbricata]